MKNLPKKGFTLLELLVVIAIVAVLSSIILIMINPATMLAKARDVRRLTDLSVLSSAFESYFAGHNLYPDDTSVIRISNSLPQGQIGPLQNIRNGWIKADGVELPMLPVDPLNYGGFVYRYTHSATSYELDCVMEYYVEKASGDNGNNTNKYEVGMGKTLLD